MGGGDGPLVACGGLGPLRESRAAQRGERAAGLLGQAIRIDTTNPPGNERALAEWLAAYLDGEGIESRVVPLPDPASPRARASGRACPGAGTARPLILLSHLDVVPADAARLDGGPVRGRGRRRLRGRPRRPRREGHHDHARLALVEAKRRGLALGRDVILLATPDEETGGRGGAELIVDQRPDLVGDARYVLTEGGGDPAGRGRARPTSGASPSPRRRRAGRRSSARGVPGHGAGGIRRRGHASARRRARARGGDALRDEGGARGGADVRGARPARGAEDRAGLCEPARRAALDPAFRTRFLADGGRAALVRTTAAITMLSGGERINVLPSEARAGIDARLLPGERCDDFVDAPREHDRRPRRLDRGRARASRADASPTETPLMEAIRRVAARSRPPAWWCRA